VTLFLSPSPLAFFVFSGFIATEFHRYQVINRLLLQEQWWRPAAEALKKMNSAEKRHHFWCFMFWSLTFWIFSV
jgi:hypothetical protein